MRAGSVGGRRSKRIAVCKPHERVLAERDRLAEEMERMAEPIAQIAHAASRIAICDREIGRLNATSVAKFGHIRLVLSGAPPIAALFQEGVVWDAFIAVAALQALQLLPPGQAREGNYASSDPPVRRRRLSRGRAGRGAPSGDVRLHALVVKDDGCDPCGG